GASGPALQIEPAWQSEAAGLFLVGVGGLFAELFARRWLDLLLLSGGMLAARVLRRLNWSWLGRRGRVGRGRRLGDRAHPGWQALRGRAPERLGRCGRNGLGGRQRPARVDR